MPNSRPVSKTSSSTYLLKSEYSVCKVLMGWTTGPKELNRHVSELADYLNAAYFGFTKIADERFSMIATTNGSRSPSIRWSIKMQNERFAGES